MKVLVVGANGQIGKHLVKMIQESDTLEAKAMIRDQDQAEYFENLGAETTVIDLEGDIDSIAKAVLEVDAVVFTAGSGPHTGPDKTMLVDLDGAIKTIIATKKTNVKRFIMVSSFNPSREGIQAASESFAPYVVAKHYADERLRSTNLDYTIIHPGGLRNEPATGKVDAAPTIEEHGTIPREDVARVILACLENNETIGKEFQVVSGDVDIKEAIASL